MDRRVKDFVYPQVANGIEPIAAILSYVLTLHKDELVGDETRRGRRGPACALVRESGLVGLVIGDISYSWRR
jgi:hypothetical protein